jgi:hypothetical protein
LLDDTLAHLLPDEATTPPTQATPVEVAETASAELVMDAAPAHVAFEPATASHADFSQPTSSTPETATNETPRHD